ncbi:alpha-L-rhamnosidase, partial [Paenibacillus sp. TAF58]
MKVTELKTEYIENPLGIVTTVPRLSWMMESEEFGQVQLAYHVLVASRPELLNENKGDLWDSGKVQSDQSIHVSYGGKPLESKRVYYWQVRIWDKHDRVSEWSSSAHWSMGILNQNEWQARWIGRAKPQNTELLPSPYM